MANESMDKIYPFSAVRPINDQLPLVHNGQRRQKRKKRDEKGGKEFEKSELKKKKGKKRIDIMA